MENNEEINEMIENIEIETDIGFNSSFNKISENYDSVCRETHGVSKENWNDNQLNFFNFFMDDFPGYLKELSENISNDFIITKSHKQATLMVLPYYGFSFYEKSDFFVYYLFSYDLSDVYLTLGLKIEGKDFEISKTKHIFKRLICSCYNSRNDLDFRIFDEKEGVNLKVMEIYNQLKAESSTLDVSNELNRLNGQKNRAKEYELATLFSKRYEMSNLPSDDDLKDDLLEFLKLYKFISDENIFEKVQSFELPHNLIYFGAPGTGKSFQLDEDKKCLVSDENCFERVTFHPDYSYANFVGTYKPVSDENENIKYKYVAGPFIRILEKAIKEENKCNDYLLIIEEINRANVAAVFGDVFQLLDRDEKGSSRYEIDVSKEVADHLGKKKIKIPSNIYIWATMNSADQGVFPMDTAFKRRWDFNYLDINNGQELIENLKFELDNETYSWNELRKAINQELLKNKINEDKLIGPFFAFNEFIGENFIPSSEFKKTFKNKIIMYLFEDVLKSRSDKLFSGMGEQNLTFGRICEKFDEQGLDIFSSNIRECPNIKINDSSEVADED